MSSGGCLRSLVYCFAVIKEKWKAPTTDASQIEPSDEEKVQLIDVQCLLFQLKNQGMEIEEKLNSEKKGPLRNKIVTTLTFGNRCKSKTYLTFNFLYFIPLFFIYIHFKEVSF